jgi:hypothetical protein
VPRFPRTTTEVTLDGAAYVGQRSDTWRFDIVDVVTGYRRAINPIMSGSAGIRHDTRATIKRTITGLTLTAEDTAVFNSLSSRLEPFMIVKGEEFQVGRYVPSDWARFPQTRGTTSSASFYDEGFIVDQQITNAFGANNPNGETVFSMISRFVAKYPITSYIEPPAPNEIFTSLASWSAGTRGGFILDQLALDGNYLAPWFDNTSVLQFRRAVDPAGELPSFDFDDGYSVVRDSIVESDNLIDAPNRFVVIGNASAALENPVVGVADVPSSAPHSIANRGFVVPDVSSRQVQSQGQASAIALNLVRNQTLVEQADLSTLPDPRHDSYDIIRWREEKWVEVAWTLPFNVTSLMGHTLRKVYSP